MIIVMLFAVKSTLGPGTMGRCTLDALLTFTIVSVHDNSCISLNVRATKTVTTAWLAHGIAAISLHWKNGKYGNKQHSNRWQSSIQY